MESKMRTVSPNRMNKKHSSKFQEGLRVNDGQLMKIGDTKHCEYNNQDKPSCPYSKAYNKLFH